MSIDQPRTPAGSPTGGQFAGTDRPEADLDLSSHRPPLAGLPGELLVLRSFGVGAGLLSRLEPGEAHAVLDSIKTAAAGRGLDLTELADEATREYLRDRDRREHDEPLTPERADEIVVDATLQLASAEVGWTQARDRYDAYVATGGTDDGEVDALDAERARAASDHAEALGRLSRAEWDLRAVADRRAVKAASRDTSRPADAVAALAALERLSAPDYRGQIGA